jgi:hypothetical protein
MACNRKTTCVSGPSAVMLIWNAQYMPFVTPAQAGVQLTMEGLKLDSGFRRNDDGCERGYSIFST